jgi:hypothetical protein
MSEFIPCPFCGILITWESIDSGGGYLIHEMEDCILTGETLYFGSLGEATEYWNRRASPWISVDEMPELVHCKDCIHWYEWMPNPSAFLQCDYLEDYSPASVYTPPDFACIEGKKKEEPDSPEGEKK